VLAASLAGVTGKAVLHLRLANAPANVATLPGRRLAELVADGAQVAALDLDVSERDGRQSVVQVLHEVVVQLGPQFPFIVVDFPPRTIPTSTPVADCCDVIITVTDRPTRTVDDGRFAHTRRFDVVNHYERDAARVPVTRVDPFVLSSEPTLPTRRDGAQVEWFETNRRSPFARAIDRLARKIVGATVGLALGGGAAFGIAHVGVILAFEELGVPIDLVCGTSMGSIVALGYASGLSGEKMREYAHRLGNVPTTLRALDPSLAGSGLLAGRRLVNTFAPLMPAEHFEDLVVPCTTVATDIESGERVVIDGGRIDRAFRASASVPVLWAPVRHDGRTLVDGAMVDPVPTDVVRDMGADLVCAVNVVPRPRAGVSTAITRLFKRASRLNPLTYVRGTSGLPDVIDVLMNSLQTVQCELGDVKSSSADVLVNVDLAEFTWIEFYRAGEIVERGRTAGEDAARRMHSALRTRLDRIGRDRERRTTVTL
jgi:NTE family protein